MKRVKRKVDTILGKADRTSDNAIAITEAILEMLEEGISFRLDIWGKAIPIKLILEPDEPESE
jgi:hypothetical protein